MRDGDALGPGVPDAGLRALDVEPEGQLGGLVDRFGVLEAGIHHGVHLIADHQIQAELRQ